MSKHSWEINVSDFQRPELSLSYASVFYHLVQVSDVLTLDRLRRFEPKPSVQGRKIFSFPFPSLGNIVYHLFLTSLDTETSQDSRCFMGISMESVQTIYKP